MPSTQLYSAFCFIYLSRHESPIDTPAQLARSGYHWSGTHLAWIYSIQDSDNPVMMTVRDNFEVNSRETLERLNGGATLGYAIEHLDYGYFAFGEYIAPQTLEKMRPMRENIFYEGVTAATVRSWYLKDDFDGFIMRVAQSGIQSYWLMDITYRQLDPAVQRILKVSSRSRSSDEIGSSGSAKPLRIDRLSGIFYLWAIGLLLALVTFIAELLHMQCKGHVTN